MKPRVWQRQDIERRVARVKKRVLALTARGLSRTDVAARLGVSMPWVSQLVNAVAHAAGAPVRPLRCSICDELGHNSRRHRKPRAVADKRYSSSNAAYQANRLAGLCDDCGASSPQSSRCKRCAARRRMRPSRAASHRNARERVAGGAR